MTTKELKKEIFESVERFGDLEQDTKRIYCNLALFFINRDCLLSDSRVNKCNINILIDNIHINDEIVKWDNLEEYTSENLGISKRIIKEIKEKKRLLILSYIDLFGTLRGNCRIVLNYDYNVFKEF